MYKNKNDNIHKSSILSNGRKKTITFAECQNLVSRTLICKSKQNLHKFIAVKGQISFLVFGYRDAFLII